MNSTPIRVVLRYAGGWSLVVFFVLLLSFIFSFLGTLFCAALAGMMLGATRQARWQALLLSLVFPAVIFTLLRGSRTELSAGQVTGLSWLCFATFWLAYAAAFALLAFERKGPQPGGERPGSPAVSPGQRGVSPAPRAAAEWRNEPDRAASSAQPSGGLSLEALQGSWHCETTGPDGCSCGKVMKIQQQELVLSIADGHGQVNLLAKAELKLVGTGPLPGLVISARG